MVRLLATCIKLDRTALDPTAEAAVPTWTVVESSALPLVSDLAHGIP